MTSIFPLLLTIDFIVSMIFSYVLCMKRGNYD